MNIFIYVGIAILIALLSTRLMRVIKLPNITGYLLTGIIIGPYILGLFFNGFKFDNSLSTSTIGSFVNNLSFLSEIALGFIAFTIGTNFNFNSLKKVGKKVLWITFFEAFGASLVVFLFLMLVHYIFYWSGAPIDTISWPLILTLAAISCATAPAATLLVIKQYKAKGPVVDTLLPVVALDDAVALILFSILFSIAKTINGSAGFDVYTTIFKPIIEIVLTLIIGAILGFIVVFMFRFFKSRANRTCICLFSILVALGLTYLFSIPELGSFSFSSLLMCMMISAVLINFRKDSVFTFERIEMITPPIFMIFFILSGANLNLTVFASDNWLILLIIAFTYIISRIIGKRAGASLGAVITRSEPTVKKYLGLTLIPQAGVAIGLATSAGKALGNIDPELGTLIVAVVLTSTMIYELIGPLCTKVALNLANEIPELKREK